MKYKNREGKEILLSTGQDSSLEFLYSHAFGRIILKIISVPVISKIVGTFLDSKYSCMLIDNFIQKNNIDMSEYIKKTYVSYNDFFTRPINPDARPINSESSSLISPSDGKVSVYNIDEELSFRVKNTWYTVKSLLKSQKLAKEYAGGNVIIIRLSVDNYHRYCYIDNGHKSSNRFIPGILQTVNPIANDYTKIYKENSREYTILHTDNFGKIIQIEVGALMVGRIVNYDDQIRFKKGTEKGKFEFGGSTIILLTKKESVKIDDDLILNTNEGFETLVKMGEKIGESLK